MRRILVIGSPGAGKSVLARRLAERFDLPLIHLDREYFSPGWVEMPRALWRARVAELVRRPEWVMDGNYSSTFDLRVPRAEAVVWLDLPRLTCLARVIRRVLRYWGTTRPDLGPDCIERFDWSFLRFVWSYPTRTRPTTLAMMARLRPDQRGFTLRSRAEIPALERALDALREAA